MRADRAPQIRDPLHPEPELPAPGDSRIALHTALGALHLGEFDGIQQAG